MCCAPVIVSGGCSHEQLGGTQGGEPLVRIDGKQVAPK